MSEPGLEIDGRLYPYPASFTLGEARVIKQLTGLTLKQFNDALTQAAADGDGSDPDLISALVYIVMHRDNPRLTVADVEAVELTSLAWVGGDTDTEEEPDSPPTGSAAAGETPPADESRTSSPAYAPV